MCFYINTEHRPEYFFKKMLFWESNVRARIDLGETIFLNFQLFDDQIRIALFYFRTWKLINDKWMNFASCIHLLPVLSTN